MDKTQKEWEAEVERLEIENFKLRDEIKDYELHYPYKCEQVDELRAQVARLEKVREAAVVLLHHSCLEEGDYLWTLDYELARRGLEEVLEVKVDEE